MLTGLTAVDGKQTQAYTLTAFKELADNFKTRWFSTDPEKAQARSQEAVPWPPSVLPRSQAARPPAAKPCLSTLELSCSPTQATTADVEAEFWRLVEHGSGASRPRAAPILAVQVTLILRGISRGVWARVAADFCTLTTLKVPITETSPRPRSQSAALPVEAVCAFDLDSTKIGAPLHKNAEPKKR